MLRIFKTNVRTPKMTTRIINALLELFPEHRINFDLEDCDHILRIEGTDFQPHPIIKVLQKLEYVCVELED